MGPKEWEYGSNVLKNINKFPHRSNSYKASGIESS